MTFPVYLNLGFVRLHPHLLFELIAYLIALRLLLRSVRHHDAVPAEVRAKTLLAALVGAVVGAKLLAWLEDPPQTWRQWSESPLTVLQGKSMVGGLLGGILAVEWKKKQMGETRKTGDAYVVPLCLGIAIGRIGCFLSGLDDRTCGTATTFSWGVDFGDGVARHPLPLYECVLMLGLALLFQFRSRFPLPPGARFREFVALYCAWRFLIDFLKPDLDFYAGLGGVQLAALIGLFFFRDGLGSLFRPWRLAHD